MAVTVSNQLEVIDLSGGLRLVLGQMALDSSYPTGGSTALAGKIGLASIKGIFFSNKGGYDIEYVRAADKLKVSYGTGSILSGPHTEVPNTTNLSAITVDFFAIGT